MKFYLTLFVGTAVASKVNLGDYQVFESLSVPPSPWVLQDDGKLDAEQTFKVRIHLKNRNIAKFQQQVLDVSTPTTPHVIDILVNWNQQYYCTAQGIMILCYNGSR
ncbi:hypothetical protein BDZ45DRAFT_750820 [Acephala macrosclerotiorum]|nr:hypothetical protein BDZ45DRAFT_750820 [Acephala macrosclerotiorum]